MDEAAREDTVQPVVSTQGFTAVDASGVCDVTLDVTSPQPEHTRAHSLFDLVVTDDSENTNVNTLGGPLRREHLDLLHHIPGSGSADADDVCGGGHPQFEHSATSCTATLRVALPIVTASGLSKPSRHRKAQYRHGQVQ